MASTTTLTEDVVGYKIVQADGSSFYGTPPIVYVVGQTYTIDKPVHVLVRGLHFCPNPLACLLTLTWDEGDASGSGGATRLFRVVAPADTVVSVGPSGLLYAASRLTVVEDVTSQAPTLLTGALRAAFAADQSVQVRRYRNGQLHGDDDTPAVVARQPLRGHVEKLWCRQGRFVDKLVRFGDGSVYAGGRLVSDAAARDEANRVLDAVDPLEDEEADGNGDDDGGHRVRRDEQRRRRQRRVPVRRNC
jgi:hypothetical protein